MLEKSYLRYSPHVDALCKKNQKGNMQKHCVEPPQKMDFFVFENNENVK